jgi:5,5'-dehydrodivanillate O-demethylase
MENAADPAHADILHHEPHSRRGLHVTNSTRGNVDDIESYTLYETPIGLMKKRVHQDGSGNEHPLIFPNNLRVGNTTQIRVPVDDTHTIVFRIIFDPTPDGSLVDESGDPPVSYTLPYKHPPAAVHPIARHQMRLVDVPGYNSSDWVQGQDYMAWETQGLIADRTDERLASSDRGIVMLREMMAAEIAKVQKRFDPIGVVRDPHHQMIDTNLEADVVVHMRAGQVVGGVSAPPAS